MVDLKERGVIVKVEVTLPFLIEMGVNYDPNDPAGSVEAAYEIAGDIAAINLDPRWLGQPLKLDGEMGIKGVGVEWLAEEED